MRLSSTAHRIFTRFLDWWRDREDERLDELVALYTRVGDGAAGLSGAGEIPSATPGRDSHSIF